MILADTNVWSELKRRRPDAQVVDWFVANAADIWLSTIVIAEIRLGIENPEAAMRRSDLEQWLADIEFVHAARTLPFRSPDAHVFGKLIARRKLENQPTKLLDAQLAAQGIAHDMTVATRNVRDFAWTGARVIDPWTV